MFVADLCIKRPVMATVALLTVVVLGVASYLKLSVEMFPEIEFPMIVVVTAYPGAGPEEVERLITKEVEDNLTLVDNVKYIESSSVEGVSIVMIRFQMGTDLDVSANDVRDQINRIEQLLPEDAEKPLVMKFDPQAFPVMRLSVSGPQPLKEVYRYTDDRIKTELGKVGGVGLLRIVGGEEREIRVAVNQDRLNAHGVTIGHVIAAIGASNLEMPGGRITQGRRETVVRVAGEVRDIGEIADAQLPGLSGRVRVRDVATVTDTVAEVRRKARLNGLNSVGIEILKQGDANTIKVGEGVRTAVSSLNGGGLLPGMKVEVVTDDSTFIRDAVSDVNSNMRDGIILTAIALYLFLHSWRGTFIIGLAMPASVIGTYILVYFAGYTINIMSMMGLAISVGVLVNNAILVLENIERYLELGEDPVTAASKGTDEISVAVLSSTMTNLVVFLPIAFMQSLVGQIFRQFAMTVVFSTILSLVISFTLTPMMAAFMLKKRKASGGPVGRWAAWKDAIFAKWDGAYDRLAAGYGHLVEGVLRHPWKTLIGFSAALLVVMFTVPRFLGAEFFPRVDQGQFAVQIETDVSSSVAQTDAVVKEVEEICRKIPEMERYYANVGGSSGGHVRGDQEAANIAEVVVKLVDKEKRKRSTDEIMNALRPQLARVAGAKFSLALAEQGGPGGKALELEIRGDDFKELNRIAVDVLAMMRGGEVNGKRYDPIPGVVDADTDWRTGKPEIALRPQRDRMRLHGVTVESLVETIRASYTGVEASQFRERDDEYTIRVILDDAQRSDPAMIRQLTVASSTGRPVRVGELTEEVRALGPTRLARKDREHKVTLSAESTGVAGGTLAAELERRLRDYPLPPGYSFRWTGTIEMMQENFGDLNQAMWMATLLTFLILAALVESWKMAVLIMLTLPFSFAGAFLGLFMRGATLNVFSIMGLVMMIGMVINNAIVVIDYTMVLRREGKPLVDAIVTASVVRLRPILMCNITAIIAMIPLAMGIGAGGEYRMPMAVAVMGGNILGGTLALFIAPALFLLAERRGEARRVASGKI